LGYLLKIHWRDVYPLKFASDFIKENKPKLTPSDITRTTRAKIAELIANSPTEPQMLRDNYGSVAKKP
jgi:hypothetical protein